METTNLVKRGVETLAVCESSLQELIGQAAAARDYGAIMELTSMAKAVADIASSVKGDGPAAAQPPAGRPAAGESGRAATRKKKTADYPKFIKRGDDLIKTGWSKKGKKEYQHKTAHKAVHAVVAALAKLGAAGAVFATDNLMAAIEPSDGSPVPEYQVYVALAWLKHTGLIDQHGRQGYSVPRAATLRQAVDAAWKETPEG